MRFLGIFEQACQTLAFVHQHGVIHRDLKPSNIMVGRFGEVQVMDWGLAKVVATRLGRGGIPGQNPWPRDKHKFVVDFTGGALAQLQQRFDVTPVASTSRGKIDNAYVIKVMGTDRWRALFDLQIDGNAPVDLRLYLKLGNKTLSETWLYQYFP